MMVEDVGGSFLKESFSPTDVRLKQLEVQRFERMQLSGSTEREDRALKGQVKQPEEAEEVSRWCSEDHTINQSEFMKPTQSESGSEVQLSLLSLSSSSFSDSFQDKGLRQTESISHSSISASLKKTELPSKQIKPSTEIVSSKKDIFPVWDESPCNKEGKKKTQDKKLNETLIEQKQQTGSLGTTHSQGNKDEKVLKQHVVTELEEVSTPKSTIMPTSRISPSLSEESVGLEQQTPPAAQTDLPTKDTSLLLPREYSASTKNLPTEEVILPKKSFPKGKSASAETSQTVSLKTPGPPDTLSSPAQKDGWFPQTFLSGGVPTETKKIDQATQADQQRPLKGILVCLICTDCERRPSYFLY